VFYWKKFKPYIILAFVVLSSTLFLWSPFLLKATRWFAVNIPNSSFEYIYKNYDGPLYIVVAKTFYNPDLIDKLYLEIKTSPYYFAAHLPLYPLAIRIFSFIFSFLQSMILSNLLFTILMSFYFYFLTKK